MLLSPAKAKDFVNAGRSRKRLSGIAAGALRRGILRIFSRIESAASGTGRGAGRAGGDPHGSAALYALKTTKSGDTSHGDVPAFYETKKCQKKLTSVRWLHQLLPA